MQSSSSGKAYVDPALSKRKSDPLISDHALDKFMRECGDATEYTATVSQYFTISELYAVKNFMYKKDIRRLLQMAHQRYEQTKLPQWKHDEKWSKYCFICKANEEINLKLVA